MRATDAVCCLNGGCSVVRSGVSRGKFLKQGTHIGAPLQQRKFIWIYLVDEGVRWSGSQNGYKVVKSF
jgi:hypothetical protein